jgi:hypothetical protein
MKNIHLLPTEKPSRLGYLTKKGKEVFNDLRLFEKSMPNILDSENQHIYITSDEEIKEGDWCYDKVLNLIFQTDNHTDFNYVNQTDNVFKIILATDQGLDGIQSIDDEFLEWFVKNPSCEFVEVLRYKNIGYRVYPLIIPKEEPTPVWKQIIESCGGEEEFMESAGLKPKQETLEEAAENYCSNSHAINEDRASWQDIEFAFKDGANYQAERMYSEEEAVQLLIKFNQEIREVEDVREWFEQFKKK